VDDRLVIDSWVGRSADRDDAVLDLAPGRHRLRVNFFQMMANSQLWLELAPAADAPLTSLPVSGGGHWSSQLDRQKSAAVEAALSAEIGRRPYSAKALISRAAFLAGQRRFTESAADFAAGLNLDPSDANVWANSAAVRLQAGDVEGYRRQCAEMLKRFGASTDRGVCEFIAKDCAIVPDAVPDFKVVMEMADRAIAPDDRDGASLIGWRVLAKGMAEYRAGHFASAVEWLGKAIAQNHDEWREVTARFFLAWA
jgi:tetratricopeptide (TPR) repeat protein